MPGLLALAKAVKNYLQLSKNLLYCHKISKYHNMPILLHSLLWFQHMISLNFANV